MCGVTVSQQRAHTGTHTAGYSIPRIKTTRLLPKKMANRSFVTMLAILYVCVVYADQLYCTVVSQGHERGATHCTKVRVRMTEISTRPQQQQLCLGTKTKLVLILLLCLVMCGCGLACHLAGYDVGVLEMLLMMSGDIEPNPGPVGVLGPNDLRAVLTELLSVSANWYTIGLALKRPPGILDAIKVGTYKEPTDCLKDMLYEWLNTSPDPSWEGLIAALKDPIVGKDHLARQLELKYCPQQAPPGTHSEFVDVLSAVGLEVVQSDPIKQQIKELDKEFRSLVGLAHGAVLEQDLEPSVFKERVSRLSPDLQAEHNTFIDNLFDRIPPTATVTDIWRKLNGYWSYLNYSLLEHIIEEFGIQDLEQRLKTFVSRLETFKRSTKLSDFVRNCRRIHSHLPSADEWKKLVVKTNRNWSTCTLKDVEKYMWMLISKFFIRAEFEVFFKEATKGCVCITWLVTPSAASKIRRGLDVTSELFMEMNGIQVITVDGYSKHASTFSKDPITTVISGQAEVTPLATGYVVHSVSAMATSPRYVDYDITSEDFAVFNDHPPELHELCDAAAEIADLYDQIGMGLGLTRGQLRIIRADTAGRPNQMQQCLTEVFSYWRSGRTLPYTWETFASVLLQPRLAPETKLLLTELHKNLAHKYC